MDDIFDKTNVGPGEYFYSLPYWGNSIRVVVEFDQITKCLMVRINNYSIPVYDIPKIAVFMRVYDED